jgi:hypothetical protein
MHFTKTHFGYLLTVLVMPITRTFVTVPNPTIFLAISFFSGVILGDSVRLLTNNKKMKWREYRPSVEEVKEISENWRKARKAVYFVILLGVSVSTYFFFSTRATDGFKIYMLFLGGALLGITIRAANPILAGLAIRKIRQKYGS